MLKDERGVVVGTRTSCPFGLDTLRRGTRRKWGDIECEIAKQGESVSGSGGDC